MVEVKADPEKECIQKHRGVSLPGEQKPAGRLNILTS